MTRGRRPLRRGVSLIELMLVVAALTTILTLCGGFLHLLLRLNDAGRTALTDARSTARLAQDVRRDVRAAATANSNDGASLQLGEGGAAKVVYAVDKGLLLRTEWAEGKAVRREAYRLGRAGLPKFEVGADRVSLTLEGPASPGYRVEAWLGKDRTLSPRSEAPR